MATKTGNSIDYIGSELELFAHARHWKRYWSGVLKPHLSGKVLEVGAGFGANTKLLHKGQDWTAIEPDPELASKIKANAGSPNTLRVIHGTLSNLEENDRFDTIIYIDVLEHIEDDRKEIEQALKHLSVGGKLIVLSPAHQALFSPFDTAVGHFRRYNKTMLLKLLPDNAVTKELFYLDSVGCLASWANAKILGASMPTPSQIKIWDSFMVRLSVLIDKLTLHKLGKTIVWILQKNA